MNANRQGRWDSTRSLSRATALAAMVGAMGMFGGAAADTPLKDAEQRVKAAEKELTAATAGCALPKSRRRRRRRTRRCPPKPCR